MSESNWKDIQVKIGDRVIKNITEVEYENEEKEEVLWEYYYHRKRTLYFRNDYGFKMVITLPEKKDFPPILKGRKYDLKITPEFQWQKN